MNHFITYSLCLSICCVLLFMFGFCRIVSIFCECALNAQPKNIKYGRVKQQQQQQNTKTHRQAIEQNE